MDCLYVFVDESGNLDFGPKGTKYFVLSAVTTMSSFDSLNKLQELKYRLLASGNGGTEHQYFHASEDTQRVRDEVFKCISNMDSLDIYYVMAEKTAVPIKYRNEKFYSLLGTALMKHLLEKYRESNYKRIILIFDQVLVRKEQNKFRKTAKRVLKKIGKPYTLYFHRTMSDFNAQIADYCAWAKYVSLERNEQRPLNALVNIKKEDVRVFQEKEK